MSKMAVVLLAALVAASCGEMPAEQWPTQSVVYGYPIKTDILPEEACAVAAVESAIPNIMEEAKRLHRDFLPQSEPYLPYWHKGGMFFIRGMDQKIPQICDIGGCAEIWRDVPRAIKVEPTYPEYGLGGVYDGHYVFVSRITKVRIFAHMFQLVAHERWHEVTPGHSHNDFYQKSLRLLLAEAKRQAKSGEIAECADYAHLL